LGLPYCGDGLVNQASEDCDDGNADDTDHCTNRCLIQDPVDQPNSIVSTNNNQNQQEDNNNQNQQEDNNNQNQQEDNFENQQEDDPCFAIQTELGLPTEWCD
jgi:cysteine-rich repeat protein